MLLKITVILSVAVLSLFMIILIANYHFEKIHIFDASIANKSPSIYLSIIILLLAILMILHTVVFAGSELLLSFNKSTICIVLLYTGFPIYSIIRLIFYALLTTFAWSMHSKYILTAWIIILISCTITNNIVHATQNKAVLRDDKCKYIAWIPFFLLITLLDVIVVITNIYLFAKPIVNLSKEISRIKQMQHNSANHSNLLKYTKLKTTIKTQLILIIIVFGAKLITSIGAWLVRMYTVWTCIDVVITSFCAILMFKSSFQLLNKIIAILSCKCDESFCFQRHMDNKIQSTSALNNNTTMDNTMNTTAGNNITNTPIQLESCV
eukprot:289654_1